MKIAWLIFAGVEPIGEQNNASGNLIDPTDLSTQDEKTSKYVFAERWSTFRQRHRGNLFSSAAHFTAKIRWEIYRSRHLKTFRRKESRKGNNSAEFVRFMKRKMKNMKSEREKKSFESNRACKTRASSLVKGRQRSLFFLNATLASTYLCSKTLTLIFVTKNEIFPLLCENNENAFDEWPHGRPLKLSGEGSRKLLTQFKNNLFHIMWTSKFVLT